MSKEKGVSVVDKIKKQIKEQASGGKYFSIKGGSKKRIRFLTEMTDAVPVVYHNKYPDIQRTPCYKYYGKSCPLCKVDDIKTKENFIWSVFDYEAMEVKLLISAAHDKSPVPHMLAAFDEYETILDRDYVISRKGNLLETSYTLMPTEKSKFKGRNKFKAMTEEEIFKAIKPKDLDGSEDDDDTEFDPSEDWESEDEDEDEDDDDGSEGWSEEDDDDDDEDDEPWSEPKKSSGNKKKKK